MCSRPFVGLGLSVERPTAFVGRCSKPVRKRRYMPKALAHELAKKRQGHLGTMSSVV